MKTSFDKINPVKFYTWNYKNVNSESFDEDLHNILSTTQTNASKQFEDTSLSVLNIHGPLKKKLLRANHSQYVTKALGKAIMRRSKLEKIYFKKQTNESLKAYTKRKNYCSKLYKKEKNYLTISIHLLYPIIRLFWKVIKPFFTNKSTFGRSIKLTEKEILKDDTEIAEELNRFFSNAVKSLNTVENTCITNIISDNLKDPVPRAIEKFKTRPSVLTIKDKIIQGNKYSFTEISKSQIEKEIKNLNVEKATTHRNTLPKVLKTSALVTAEALKHLLAKH